MFSRNSFCHNQTGEKDESPYGLGQGALSDSDAAARGETSLPGNRTALEKRKKSNRQRAVEKHRVRVLGRLVSVVVDVVRNQRRILDLSDLARTWRADLRFRSREGAARYILTRLRKLAKARQVKLLSDGSEWRVLSEPLNHGTPLLGQLTPSPPPAHPPSALAGRKVKAGTKGGAIGQPRDLTPRRRPAGSGKRRER